MLWTASVALLQDSSVGPDFPSAIVLPCLVQPGKEPPAGVAVAVFVRGPDGLPFEELPRDTAPQCAWMRGDPIPRAPTLTVRIAMGVLALAVVLGCALLLRPRGA